MRAAATQGCNVFQGSESRFPASLSDNPSLFAAAVDFDLRLPDLSAFPREEVGARLVNHFLTRWEDDDILKALLRSAASNEGAAERVRSIFAEQVAPAIAALCRDPKSAPIRAGLVSSQILGFALGRYILRLPPIVTMRREAILEWLGPTIQRYICG